jgi:hypothetical protein
MANTELLLFADELRTSAREILVRAMTADDLDTRKAMRVVAAGYIKLARRAEQLDRTPDKIAPRPLAATSGKATCRQIIGDAHVEAASVSQAKDGATLGQQDIAAASICSHTDALIAEPRSQTRDLNARIARQSVKEHEAMQRT